ncbi:MAG: DUF1036 domain-containing protein [Pseudomonadota bacterium]
MALERLFLKVGAIVALAVACGFPASAQSPSGWSVCNRTSFVLETATARPEGPSLIVEGWTKIRPGGCEVVLTAPLSQGVHYLYSRSSDAHRGGSREWGGGDEKLCVDPTGGFSVESPPDCAAMGLVPKSFRPVLIERRNGWMTVLEETEKYTEDRARAAGVQRLLGDATGDRAKIDGYLGRRTKRSIAAFLKDNGLKSDATDDQLIDALERRAIERGRDLGLTLCNRTRRRIWAAIARRRGDEWESRGWWQLEAGGCARAIDEALIQTDYFVYGEMEVDETKYLLERGSDTFCIARAKFAIAGRRDCEASAYESALFAASSTPEEGRLVFEFFERDFIEPPEAG